MSHSSAATWEEAASGTTHNCNIDKILKMEESATLVTYNHPYKLQVENPSLLTATRLLFEAVEELHRAVQSGEKEF